MDDGTQEQEKPSNKGKNNAASHDEKTQQEMLENFSSQTTLHGFRFLFDSSLSRPRRTIWFFVIFVCAICLVSQIHTSIGKLLEYKSIISKEFRHQENLLFPAVSICNQNFVRKSQIMNTEVQWYIDQLDSRNTAEGNISTSIDLEKVLKQSGHNLSTMLKNCHWNRQKCGPHNFLPFYSLRFGHCYTFNSGKPGHQLLHVSAPGRSHELTMELDAEPAEYYGPLGRGSTGFRIFIHHQSDREPIMEDVSDAISTGFSHEFKILRKEMNFLKAPYNSSCRDGNRDNLDDGKYSQAYCMRQCITGLVLKSCKCRLVGMATGGNISSTRYCKPSERQCYESITAKIRLRDCRCPKSCQEIIYLTQISSAYYPSEHRVEYLLKAQNGSSNVSVDDIRTFQDRYRRRYAAVSLFYKTLTVEVTTEIPTYFWYDLGGDIGGNMGLFLGCSVITVCELLDFIIRLLLARRRACHITQRPGDLR